MSDLRMPELNRVFLAGRLVRDPELRYTPNGTPVCKMRLAVPRTMRTRDGERKEETLFINVSAWEKQAEFCGQYLKNGRPILVEGVLRSDEWEDKATGQKRSVIEVRASRIQPLDWADRDTPAGDKADTPKIMEEITPEDDIPF